MQKYSPRFELNYAIELRCALTTACENARGGARVSADIPEFKEQFEKIKADAEELLKRSGVLLGDILRGGKRE